MSDLEKRVVVLEKKVATLETALSKSAKPKRKSSGPTAYAIFIKERMPEIIEKYPNLKQPERMAKCAELWKEQSK